MAWAAGDMNLVGAVHRRVLDGTRSRARMTKLGTGGGGVVEGGNKN